MVEISPGQWIWVGYSVYEQPSEIVEYQGPPNPIDTSDMLGVQVYLIGSLLVMAVLLACVRSGWTNEEAYRG